MPKQPIRVFVVDDSTAMQRIAQRLLMRIGFQAIPMGYGEECLKRAPFEVPDLILMDVILPDGNGMEFVHRLASQEATKNIPVIFTTSTLDIRKDTGHEVFEINGQSYRAFAKPLHQRKLASVIRKEIDRKKFGGPLPKDIEVIKRVQF